MNIEINLKKIFKNKTILITGGTGSFGSYFIKMLFENYKPKKIIIFSRDEMKQFEMKNKPHFKKYLSKMRFFIGDIRDLNRLIYALNNDVDYLIHAAALKHVESGEYNPFEVIKTNILGSQNIIEAALRSNVKKVIALSTDKASSPVNLYGATKLASDKLFVSANNFKGSKKTIFSVVRYGNVMHSRGSVVPLFLKQKKQFNKITITDVNMTRFSINLEQSISFVMQSIYLMHGGEIFVPKIPSYKIKDLISAFNMNKQFKVIGIRPGEKLHEEMISKSESINCLDYKNHYVIFSNSKFVKGYEYFSKNKNKFNEIGKKLPLDFSYSSEKNKFLSVKQLKEYIKDFNS